MLLPLLVSGAALPTSEAVPLSLLVVVMPLALASGINLMLIARYHGPGRPGPLAGLQPAPAEVWSHRGPRSLLRVDHSGKKHPTDPTPTPHSV